MPVALEEKGTIQKAFVAANRRVDEKSFADEVEG